MTRREFRKQRRRLIALGGERCDAIETRRGCKGVGVFAFVCYTDHPAVFVPGGLVCGDCADGLLAEYDRYPDLVGLWAALPTRQYRDGVHVNQVARGLK